MGYLWEEEAWNDYLYWQKQDKKMVKRINTLLQDVHRHPFEGLGKPEPLKGNLSGWWSRRIDEKHRIVYRPIDGGHIQIAACKLHYGE